jgi:hypothetical protein
MLDAAARLARRRSVIVVVSDLIGQGDWERSLLRLSQRHEVVALRIVDSGDPLLRASLRTAVGDRDARLTAGMRRAGVPVHRIGTSDDLARSLVDVVASTHRRRA